MLIVSPLRNVRLPGARRWFLEVVCEGLRMMYRPSSWLGVLKLWVEATAWRLIGCILAVFKVAVVFKPRSEDEVLAVRQSVTDVRGGCQSSYGRDGERKGRRLLFCLFDTQVDAWGICKQGKQTLRVESKLEDLTNQGYGGLEAFVMEQNLRMINGGIILI